MYRDSYALALIVDGKIQKESDDGTVLIPFASEYSLRLKNKLRKRAVADVFIDGRLSAKGIVIDSNGMVDLERFVEDNLSEGKKFKLVRLTDPKVDQPNDSEVGIIEVNFYQEKDIPVVEKTIINDYWNNHYCFHNCFGHCLKCCNNWSCTICHPTTQPYWKDNIVWCTNTITSGSLTSNIISNQTFTASCDSNSLGGITANVNLSNSTLNTGESAATIEGGTSLQKFSSAYIDVDRSNPVTLRLKVKGLSKVLNSCPSCGYKRKKDVKFCPNDGTQLVA